MKWSLALGLLSLALLAVAGWQMTMGYYAQTEYASPSWAVDVTNDRELVGLGHDVFFGQVTKRQGQTRDRGFPETQFSVSVLETLKGDLSGKIQVNQHGGRGLSGKSFRMSDDPDLLERGSTYLFVTRTSSTLGLAYRALGPGQCPTGCTGQCQCQRHTEKPRCGAAKDPVQGRRREPNPLRSIVVTAARPSSEVSIPGHRARGCCFCYIFKARTARAEDWGGTRVPPPTSAGGSALDYQPVVTDRHQDGACSG